MPEMVNLKINDISVSIEAGSTILDAAKKINIKIPTLCHHEDLCIAGNCRVCVVEQKGVYALKASCATPAEDNMEFFTKRKVSFHKIKLSVDHFIPDSIDNDEFFTVNPSKVVQSPLRGQCIYLLT